MAEPPFKCSTKKALNELATELNLREKIPHWNSMAGLSYTPGNPADLQAYLVHYAQLKDEDKKFTLMEMILDAMAQQSNERDFMKYWRKVKPILMEDYVTHEVTVHYWKEMTMGNFERSEVMTPLVRDLVRW